MSIYTKVCIKPVQLHREAGHDPIKISPKISYRPTAQVTTFVTEVLNFPKICSCSKVITAHLALPGLTGSAGTSLSSSNLLKIMLYSWGIGSEPEDQLRFIYTVWVKKDGSNRGKIKERWRTERPKRMDMRDGPQKRTIRRVRGKLAEWGRRSESRRRHRSDLFWLTA